MKTLTPKEETIMEHFWEHGEMLISKLQTYYAEPRPHVNTLSTLVKILEEKGFVSHKVVTARCFIYYPIITREQYGERSVATMVSKFFSGSYRSLVSTFVKQDKLSKEEVKELLKIIDDGEK
jgi:BlaI family penicillinase repressor